MSLFKKKYIVIDWFGRNHLMTAKKLYERVLKDSKSDYNWITSATELVKVCDNPLFPEMYGQAIKIIILNCFANIELRQEEDSSREETDLAAVYSCYHSLPNTDETVIKVKQKYLRAVITGITKYTQCEVRFPLHPGPTYDKICENWINTKFNEYVSNEKIDFDELREKLYEDFEMTVKAAEEEGVFEEDDAKYHEEIRKFLASIPLKDI